MKTLQDSIQEYRLQLEKGDIRIAYQGLMGFMLHLKSHFRNQYPDYLVSGSLYQGYMDMSYFAITPKPLAEKQLKIALVFIHDRLRFCLWLAGANKNVQAHYRRHLSENACSPYILSKEGEGVDSIIEYELAVPDFSNLNMLTQEIEKETLRFSDDMMKLCAS
jgi:hypothetical protein